MRSALVYRGGPGAGAAWRRGFVRAVWAVALFWWALAAAAQEPVRVQAERHDGFARVIITFTDRMSLPPYAITTENGVLVMSVEGTRMAGLLPDIATVLGDYIAIARFDPDMTSLRMGLRGPLQINTIAAGEQLYIDFLPPGWVGLPPALPPEIVARLAERSEDAARIAEERRRAEMVAQYDPQASVRVGRHPTFTRVMFEWNAGTRANFAREGDVATISFDWPVPIDLYPIRSDRPAEIAAVENEITALNSIVAFTLSDDAEARFYEQSSAVFVLDIDAVDAEREGIDLESLARAMDAAAPAAAALESEAAAPAAEDLGPVTPFVSTVGATVRVVFPFREETAAAAFRRGDVLWMVFDTHEAMAEPDARSSEILDGLASRIDIERSGSAYMVRTELNGDRIATLGAEGRSWVLSLGDMLLSAASPVVPERRRAQLGLEEIAIDLARPSRIHQLRDPDVGDILDVVTVFPPAVAAVRELRYVDFELPRSAHGLVVKPLHDGVSVRIEDTRAIISADMGLRLSPVAEARVIANPDNRVGALDLVGLTVANPLDFNRRRDQISQRASQAEGRELDRARLELAQFYLANGFAHEALGMLSLMREQLRQANLEVAMNTTLAAANTLAGRTEEALRLLEAEPLRSEADGLIWRTIARAESGDFAGARRDVPMAATVIDYYPGRVRARFHLAGARAGVMENDAAMATGMLNAVELSVLDADQLALYELLGGMIDQQGGRHADALESYGRVIAADRRPTTVEAVLRTIELLDAMERLDVPRAIETLWLQATIWRGGPLELEILDTLTGLQYREGDYRDAFALTREAAGTFADGPMLDAMVDRARGTFSALFIDGAADRLDPIEALAIYYDYRHLTPPGADGDLMIRNLAQRLIRVDLLDQAAALLDYQIENRLAGAARAQLAADLAVIHIANRNPAAALQVLYETRLAGLPPALERQRRVLEAGALVQAGRQHLALDILSGLEGRDIELLRVEANWSAGRYRQASELIETLYGSDLASGDLSPVARLNIVKAAVGYVLAGDTLALSRLRSRFSELMATTPEWPMFSFVVEDVDSGGAGFRDIVRQVADTSGINGFLNAYRETYAGENAVTPLRAAPQTGTIAGL